MRDADIWILYVSKNESTENLPQLARQILDEIELSDMIELLEINVTIDGDRKLTLNFVNIERKSFSCAINSINIIVAIVKEVTHFIPWTCLHSGVLAPQCLVE